METIHKITEDREVAARWHNSKILNCYANTWRESGQLCLVLLKDRNWATVSDNEKVKQMGENILKIFEPG